MLVAAACVAALYLVGVTNEWWPTPDSALYQGLGRNLIRGEGYRFNGRIETTVAPGFPAILGAIRLAFGDGFWAPNLFVALCGLGGLAMAYLTLARQTDRRTAFAVTLTTGLCYRYYDYSHLILTDVPFVLLFWTTAYCCLRAMQGSWAWCLAVAPLAVAGIAVRAPGLLLLGPLAVGIVLDRGSQAKSLRRLLVAVVLLAALFAIAGYFHWLAESISGRAPTYAITVAKRTGVANRLYDLASGLYRLPKLTANIFLGQSSLAPVGVMIILLAVLGAREMWREGRRLASTTWLVNFVATCIAVGGHFLLERYMVALYPLMLLLIFRGVFVSMKWFLRRKGRAARPYSYLKIATVLTAVFLSFNVPKILRDSLYYSFHAHTGRYLEVVRDGRFVDLQPVVGLLRDRFDPQASIAVRRDRASILHFLSECKAVRFLKTERQTAADAEAVYDDLLAKADIRAVVTDAGGVPEPFRRRFDELLSASGAPLIYEGKYYNVYDWSEVRGTTRPATRRAP